MKTLMSNFMQQNVAIKIVSDSERFKTAYSGIRHEYVFRYRNLGIRFMDTYNTLRVVPSSCMYVFECTCTEDGLGWRPGGWGWQNNCLQMDIETNAIAHSSIMYDTQPGDTTHINV